MPRTSEVPLYINEGLSPVTMLEPRALVDASIVAVHCSPAPKRRVNELKGFKVFNRKAKAIILH